MDEVRCCDGGRDRSGRPKEVSTLDDQAREDVRRELQAHLRLRAEELEAQGWSPEDARREAVRLFGDYHALREACEELATHQVRKRARLESWARVFQDLKHSLRMTVRNPAFSLLSFLTLALGIGATTAIFSVVHGILVRPLPFEDPQALVQVYEKGREGGIMNTAWPNLQDWRRESRSFDGLAGYGQRTVTAVGGAEPARVEAAAVSVDFWKVFRIRPERGRLTGPDDHRVGTHAGVVISENLATRLFNSDEVVGRTLSLSGAPALILGVAQSGFDFPIGTDLWYPLEMEDPSTSRTAHNWSVVGRLRRGSTVEGARSELDELTIRMLSAVQDEDPEYLAAGAHLYTLQDRIVQEVKPPLAFLMAASILVLVLACTNLASMHLARGTARVEELAVRSSLGAERSRLVGQLVTEAAVLATVGSGLGILLAVVLLKVIKALGRDLPRIDSIGVTPGVLAFTVFLAGATVVGFGLIPALRLTGTHNAAALRSGRSGRTVREGRVWSLLVGGQVALTLVLLVGAGLLTRSFRAVLSEDSGFGHEAVLASELSLNQLRYQDPAAAARFYSDLVGQLSTVPGVQAAGIISTPPLNGWVPAGRIQIDGNSEKHVEDVGYVVISPGVLEALDVPLFHGRGFEPTDQPSTPHVVLVNQAFVNRHWPGRDPLGRTVSGGGMDSYWNADPPVFGTVVGVVGDLRHEALTRPPRPTVFWTVSQRPGRVWGGAHLFVEAGHSNLPGLATAVRSVVTAADPDIPLDLFLLSDRVQETLASRQFLLFLVGGFAVLALVLSAVGIFGVVSYSAARRQREIGIRIAVGANPRGIPGLILGGLAGIVGLGLLCGLLGAAALTRLLSGSLYGVEPLDLATFVGMPALVGFVALLAAAFPAIRSSRQDPSRTIQA